MDMLHWIVDKNINDEAMSYIVTSHKYDQLLIDFDLVDWSLDKRSIVGFYEALEFSKPILIMDFDKFMISYILFMS